MQGAPGSFASRVAAGHNTNAGISALVVHSLRSFEHVAVRLARSRALRRAARRVLVEQNAITEGRRADAGRTVRPLFDTARTARNMRRAYAAMFELRNFGEAPRHIVIGPMAPVAAAAPDPTAEIAALREENALLRRRVAALELEK